MRRPLQPCAARDLRFCWPRCCGSSRLRFTTIRMRGTARSSLPAPMPCAPSSRSLPGHRLLELPLFAVGEHTAAAARGAGFEQGDLGQGDAAALRDVVLASVKAKELKKASPLLYLAGADLARDLAGELGGRGFTVVTQTTYRMVPSPACRARSATPSRPTRSRRCCTIRGAARAPSWRRRAPPGSKSRRWRSRNAAFPPRSPRSSATPGPPRSWWRRRRMKMPYLRRWSRALRVLIALQGVPSEVMAPDQLADCGSSSREPSGAGPRFDLIGPMTRAGLAAKSGADDRPRAEQGTVAMVEDMPEDTPSVAGSRAGRNARRRPSTSKRPKSPAERHERGHAAARRSTAPDARSHLSPAFGGDDFGHDCTVSGFRRGRCRAGDCGVGLGWLGWPPGRPATEPAPPAQRGRDRRISPPASPASRPRSAKRACRRRRSGRGRPHRRAGKIAGIAARRSRRRARAVGETRLPTVDDVKVGAAPKRPRRPDLSAIDERLDPDRTRHRARERRDCATERTTGGRCVRCRRSWRLDARCCGPARRPCSSRRWRRRSRSPPRRGVEAAR